MKPWWITKIVKMLTFFLVGTLVLGLVVMLLWNALIPDLFHGPSMSFWQAVGLLVLTHILLRGWGRWFHSNGWRHERWRRKFEEKLAAMTPEEREKFKEEWQHRCGHIPGQGSDKSAPANA
jgi:hypothetical protein